MSQPVKKLKESKSKIILKSGHELQFHVPRTEPKDLCSLMDNLPPESKNKKLEIEIGCGKGEFIAHRASTYGQTFFVGIDRRHDRFTLTEKKLKRLAEGKNWVILEADARLFDMQKIPKLDCLHVYHPDPWPKARHHKHRFFRSPQAKEWTLALKPGAALRFSTDHRDYFEEVLEIVDTWEHLDRQWVYQKQSHHGVPLTHFEKIFLSKNEPVYKALFIRV